MESNDYLTSVQLRDLMHQDIKDVGINLKARLSRKENYKNQLVSHE